MATVYAPPRGVYAPPPPPKSDSRYAAIIIIGIILILIVFAMIWRLFSDTLPAAALIVTTPKLASVIASPGQASIPGSVPVVEVSDGKCKKKRHESDDDSSCEKSDSCKRSSSSSSESLSASKTVSSSTSKTVSSSLSASKTVSSSSASKRKQASESVTSSGERSIAPGSESRPSTLSSDQSSATEEGVQTFFETIDPHTHQHKKAPSIDGVVNTVIAHGGFFYAHVTGKGVSGVYKLKNLEWICIVGTAGNASGKCTRDALDCEESNTIKKLFEHRDGTLCFNTAEKVFKIEDGSVKEIKMELVKDYHYTENDEREYTEAKITSAGEMYLGDRIAKSNDQSIRFRDSAKVRTHEGKLLFITHRNALVALDVTTASHVTIAPRVEAFDVAPEHYITYAVGRQVHLRTPQGAKTFSCGGRVLDIAACSGGVLVAIQG